VTNPRRIPAKRYYDRAFYELECERLWPRVWQMACRLEEIPQVGDWVEYKILDKSVILMRTRSGVKAFHNACRHRGVKLLDGHGSCEANGFSCPFHGWRWNIDGENTFVFGRHLFEEEDLDPADLRLRPCRVEFWAGCAFINFDDNAPPLLEAVAPVAQRLDPRKVDKLRVEWWVSTVLPANWKVAMEAFMEGLHVMRTHPQLQEAYLPLPGYDQYTMPAEAHPGPPASLTAARTVDMLIEHRAILSEGMGGMVHADDLAVMDDLKRRVTLPDEPRAAAAEWMRLLNDELLRRNRERGVDYPDLNALGPVSPVQFIFPHFFLLPGFANMSSYRIRPLGPESCLFELWSLVLYPEGEVRPRPTAPTPMPHDDPRFPAVPIQDYSNIPRQQEGLHAAGFEFMRLSSKVEGLISNYHRVIDGFIAGAPDEKLLHGVQAASADFDCPIKDVGF
jgi:phenylpropionate dioxygenase-like ring-hydroxylating dioxygenase large terminal subunit